MTDAVFLAAFESCDLQPQDFHHADHLRVAWLYLHCEPYQVALHRIRAGLQKFAAHHKVAHIYHETLTVAWVRLLATHDEPDFDGFLAANQSRLTKDLLHRFWSPELLASEEARRQWVAPDRQDLPGI